VPEPLVLKISGDSKEAIAAVESLAKAITGLPSATKPATEGANAIGNAFQNALSTMAGFVSGTAILRTATAAFSMMSNSIIGMNQTLETSTLQFTTLMGSSDRAREHVKDLFEIAKKTPFETGPIIQASRMLQTFGGAALNTKENILLVGDAAAATQAPINELGFWIGRMYSAVQAGRPFGEAAMRLQELAVLTPQARNQMEDLQKSGKSTAEVWAVMTDNLKQFSGAMEKQAGTWVGVTSTMSDTINILVAGIGQPFFEFLRDSIAKLNEWLGSEEVQDWANWIRDEVSGAINGAIDAFTRLSKWYVESGMRDTLAEIGQQFIGIAENLAEIFVVMTRGENISKSFGDLVGHALVDNMKAFGEWLHKIGGYIAEMRLEVERFMRMVNRTKKYGVAGMLYSIAEGAAEDQQGGPMPSLPSAPTTYGIFDVTKGIGPANIFAPDKDNKLAAAVASTAQKKLQQSINAGISDWLSWGAQHTNTGSEASRLFASANLNTPSAFQRVSGLAGGWQDFTGFGGSSSVMDADVMQTLNFATWAGGNWGTLGTAQSKLDEWSGLVGKTTEKTTDWFGSLKSVNDQLIRLGQVVGQGGFQKHIQDVANIMGGAEMAQSGGAAIGDAIVNSTNMGEMVSGLVGGGVQGVMGIIQATSSTSKAKNVIGGMAAGAAMGSVVPGLGTAIGAGVGALVGLFRSTTKALNKEANANISEMEKSLFGVYGSLENIEKAGGAAGKELVAAWGSQGQEGLKQFNAKLDAFNKAIESTKKLVSDLSSMKPGDVLSKSVLAQMGSGTLSEDAKAAIGDFMKSQTGNLVTYVQSFISGGGDLAGKAGAGIFGAMAAAASQMKGSGSGLSDIAATLGPMIGQVSGATGMSNSFFDLLNKVSGSEAIGAASKNADSLAGIAATLFNLGDLNQETFSSLTAGLSESFKALKDANLNDREAAEAMKTDLQKIWEISKDTGLVVDEATQALIDQGIENGEIGEKYRSSSDQLKDSINALISKLGGLPGAIASALGGASTSYYTGGGSSYPGIAASGREYAEEYPSYDIGGIVRSDQLANIHAGEIVGPVDFMKRALQGAMAAMDIGGGINVNVQVSTLDAADFDSVVRDKVVPRMVDALRYNARGSLTNMKLVLGVG
jgi:hypothetical protein